MNSISDKQNVCIQKVCLLVYYEGNGQEGKYKLNQIHNKQSALDEQGPISNTALKQVTKKTAERRSMYDREALTMIRWKVQSISKSVTPLALIGIGQVMLLPSRDSKRLRAKPFANETSCNVLEAGHKSNTDIAAPIGRRSLQPTTFHSNMYNVHCTCLNTCTILSMVHACSALYRPSIEDNTSSHLKRLYYYLCLQLNVQFIINIPYWESFYIF